MSSDAIDQALAASGHLPGGLLQVLHGIADRLGHIPPDAIGRVAAALNLSRAEVHGVVTFYHDFRSEPPGRHVLKLCRAEACQAMGSEKLAAALEQRLGCNFGQTSPDGAVTLEPVYCLGNCAAAPSLLLDGQLRGRLSETRLAGIVDALVAPAKERA
ncbi:formate dehydrogenase subunit gamma [Nannocystis radixulma]|uniref:Formate dehydrogenase subunit gamma n=1 Tax=Nannocystis radixulma TaxID=2995305 RepID=A0ABT5BHY1_9BACT|nr:formate dehydrogenase subunit gamma [Nannocystis radixulma]MDC0673755.1 formate dehydrogenase subunit gamma [Nannocystis radixulma]